MPRPKNTSPMQIEVSHRAPGLTLTAPFESASATQHNDLHLVLSAVVEQANGRGVDA